MNAMSYTHCDMGVFDFFKQLSSRKSITKVSTANNSADSTSDTNSSDSFGDGTTQHAISTTRSSIDEHLFDENREQVEFLGSIQNYDIVRELGRGATAVVQLGKQKDGDQLVALKVYKTSLLKKMRDIKRVGRKMIVSTALDKVQEEIAIMKKLNHRNLLNLLEVFDDNAETLVLMLEYAPKGQIMHWDAQRQVYVNMNKTTSNGDVFEESELRNIVRQLLLGLEFLHKNNICHRDLKPENILVGDDGVYKIADFGVAHLFEDQSGTSDNQSEATGLVSKRGYVSSTAGTYAFMGPETLKGQAFCAYAADLWALGITIYALTFGTIPYYHPDVNELFEMIGTQPLPCFNDNNNSISISDELTDFLMHILEKDPAKRYGIPECKAHPWVTCDMDEEQRQIFRNSACEQVSVNADEVAKAVTRVTSFNVVLRMKIGANKWKRKAMSSIDAKKKEAALTQCLSKSISEGCVQDSVLSETLENNQTL